MKGNSGALRQWIGRAKKMAVSSVFAVFGSSAAILVLGLVNSVILGRLLGPKGRGEIAAAILWPTQFLFFASTGMLQSIVFHCAIPDAKTEKVSSNALIIGGLQSLIAVAGGYFLIPHLLGSHGPEEVFACRLFLYALPFYMLNQYGQNILQGRMFFKEFNRQRMILPVGYIVGVVALAAVHRLNAVTAIWVVSIFHFITCVYSWFEIWRHRIFRSFSPDWKLAVDMLKFGGKIYPGEMTGTLNLRLDQMLLAFWFPAAELGLYVAAVSGATVSEVMSYAFRMVTSPRVAAQETWESKTRVLNQLFRRYIVSSILFSGALMALMPIAIPLLFGHAFNRSVPVAEVLLVGSFCLGARNLLAGASQAIGDPWLNTVAEIGALPVTIGTLLYLLPRMGIMGAAISSLLAYFTQLVIVLIQLYKKHGISPLFLVKRLGPSPQVTVTATAGGIE